VGTAVSIEILGRIGDLSRNQPSSLPLISALIMPVATTPQYVDIQTATSISYCPRPTALTPSKPWPENDAYGIVTLATKILAIIRSANSHRRCPIQTPHSISTTELGYGKWMP
jgi:hypothetical protein